VPTGVSARLTWEGVQQDPVAFTVPGPSPTGLYVVQVPLAGTVEGSGLYDYWLDVTLSFADGHSFTASYRDQAGIVGQDASP
jgi:hypothetical protein